ncbi:hypothetical protein [Tenacibaculum phage Larrie]|nr:hypothetical protein [Tenacibaculum phage Larrie]
MDFIIDFLQSNFAIILLQIMICFNLFSLGFSMGEGERGFKELLKVFLFSFAQCIYYAIQTVLYILIWFLDRTFRVKYWFNCLLKHNLHLYHTEESLKVINETYLNKNYKFRFRPISKFFFLRAYKSIMTRESKVNERMKIHEHLKPKKN